MTEPLNKEPDLVALTSALAVTPARTQASEAIGSRPEIRQTRVSTDAKTSQVSPSTRANAAHWLQLTFSIDIYDLQYAGLEAFWDSCEVGDLEFAKWLAKTCSLEPHHVNASSNYALWSACTHNHVKTAAWLVDEFSLTVDDVRCANDCILRECCARGCKDSVRWLVNTFKLDASILRSGGDICLLVACASGNSTLVRWLLDKTRVFKDAVVTALPSSCVASPPSHPSSPSSLDSHAIVYASPVNASQPTPTVKAVSALGFDEAASSLAASALHEACCSNSMKTVRVIQRAASRVGVDLLRDAIVINFIRHFTVARVCGRGHSEMLEWIYAVFGIPCMCTRHLLAIASDPIRPVSSWISPSHFTLN